MADLTAENVVRGFEAKIIKDIRYFNESVEKFFGPKKFKGPKDSSIVMGGIPLSNNNDTEAFGEVEETNGAGRARVASKDGITPRYEQATPDVTHNTYERTLSGRQSRRANVVISRAEAQTLGVELETLAEMKREQIMKDWKRDFLEMVIQGLDASYVRNPIFAGFGEGPTVTHFNPGHRHMFKGTFTEEMDDDTKVGIAGKFSAPLKLSGFYELEALMNRTDSKKGDKYVLIEDMGLAWYKQANTGDPPRSDRFSEVVDTPLGKGYRDGAFIFIPVSDGIQTVRNVSKKVILTPNSYGSHARGTRSLGTVYTGNSAATMAAANADSLKQAIDFNDALTFPSPKFWKNTQLDILTAQKVSGWNPGQTTDIKPARDLDSVDTNGDPLANPIVANSFLNYALPDGLGTCFVFDKRAFRASIPKELPVKSNYNDFRKSQEAHYLFENHLDTIRIHDELVRTVHYTKDGEQSGKYYSFTNRPVVGG